MVSASSLTDSIISVHTKDAPSLMFTMDRSYAEQYFIKTGSWEIVASRIVLETAAA